MAGRAVRFEERAELVQKFTDGRARKRGAGPVPVHMCRREPQPPAADDGAGRSRLDARRPGGLRRPRDARSSERRRGRRTGWPASASAPVRDCAGQAGRPRPDPHALDVAARPRDPEGAGPCRKRGVPRGKAFARGARQLARPSPRGERRPTRRRRAKDQPLRVAAALLASAEGYTPRATKLLDAAREELGTVQEAAGALAENLPEPKPPRRSRRRRRRKKRGQGHSNAGGRESHGCRDAAGRRSRRITRPLR